MRAAAALLLLSACLGACQALDLLDPAGLVETLSTGGAGLERWKRPDFWQVALPSLQKEPPQPTDAELQIIDYPKIKVYVRKFSGFATEGTILKEANGFMDILDDEGREDYGEEIIWVAIYDPPQKLMHRHNEIHLPAGQKKKKQQAEQVLAS